MNPAVSLLPSSVIKVGGSLFGTPDLPSRLANFLRDFGRPRPILLAGGGDAVETIRRWDRIYDLGEEESHWLALRVLSLTARVLEKLLPELSVVDAAADFAPLWRSGRIPVYDPYHFIADVDEEHPDPLPRRWRVTSDSIAARMAVCFGAPELVLLKSITLPERMSIREAADHGIVDPHFPTAARDVERIVAVNLRRDEPSETELYEDWRSPSF